jgi:hypothetical protein
MLHRFWPALGIATVAFGQIGLAADLPRKSATSLPAPFSWTGFYIGLNAGYGWSDPPVSIIGVGSSGWNRYFPDPFRERNFDRNGFLHIRKFFGEAMDFGVGEGTNGPSQV